MASSNLTKRASEVATEIFFLRAAANRAAVVVEGASDARILSRFLATSECDIVTADSKSNAIQVAEILARRATPGFVVILDRDFDHLCNVNHENDNVLYVDDNDIDVMIFRSSALSAVLIECGSKSKLEAAGGWQAARDLIVEQARKLGAIRLFSRVNNRNLRFDGLGYDFVCRKTLKSDQSEVVKRVLDHSRMPRTDFQQDLDAAARLLDEHQDHWALCQGHDLASYLGRALQGYCGSCKAGEATADLVSRLLRLSYDSADFERSELRVKLLEWQGRNGMYQVLPKAA